MAPILIALLLVLLLAFSFRPVPCSHSSRSRGRIIRRSSHGRPRMRLMGAASPEIGGPIGDLLRPLALADITHACNKQLVCSSKLLLLPSSNLCELGHCRASAVARSDENQLEVPRSAHLENQQQHLCTRALIATAKSTLTRPLQIVLCELATAVP